MIESKAAFCPTRLQVCDVGVRANYGYAPLAGALALIKHLLAIRFALTHTTWQPETAAQDECGEHSCGPEIRESGDENAR